MLSVDIPGFGALRLAHLVLDYNGTLALDGRPRRGVKARLGALARVLQIHVVTADTFGTVRAALRGLDCTLRVLGPAAQDRAKAAYVRRLGARRTVCIGNGRNDALMLRRARLGIAVIEREGAAREAVVAADIVVDNAAEALDLLLKLQRLTATLRA